MALRFSSDMNRLRAALRGKQDGELIAVLKRELGRLGVAALAADNAMRYIASNAQAQELTGFSESALLELSVLDLAPASHALAGEGQWREFIKQGAQRGQREIRTRSGKPVPVRYWAFASVAPGVHVSLMMPIDIA